MADMLVPAARGGEPRHLAARPPGAPPVSLQRPPRIYAAIDLGTNNCRLLIARSAGERGSADFSVIDAFSRVVRLGEGLAQSGRLGEAAMDRALAALSICADKLRRRGVELSRAVATEACRQAANGAEFIARVARETGILLDVISAREEARLAVLGCRALLEAGDGPALVFDIGGGSTEVVLVGDQDDMGGAGMRDWISVPWGVVSLTEARGGDDPDPEVRAARYAAMHDAFAGSLAPFAARIAPVLTAASTPRLLGTSGTVTTLASLYLGLPQYDRAAVDGLVVPAADMGAVCRRLAAMSLAERCLLPCIGRERAELVVAGCAILESILGVWPAPRLGIADRGIREGILRGLIGGAR